MQDQYGCAGIKDRVLGAPYSVHYFVGYIPWNHSTPPYLKALLACNNAKSVGQGLSTPGGAEARHLQKAVECAKDAAGSRCAGGLGGGIVGGVPVEGALGESVPVEVGNGSPCTDLGDPFDKPVFKPKLRLLLGENMRDILRNFALPTLQRSDCCNFWHHGGL